MLGVTQNCFLIRHTLNTGDAKEKMPVSKVPVGWHV